eukprot:5108377-Prymnesium_polylepis.1
MCGSGRRFDEAGRGRHKGACKGGGRKGLGWGSITCDENSSTERPQTVAVAPDEHLSRTGARGNRAELDE